MLKYTLCLIKQGSKFLLLNRENQPWMGCWNGIGGKIEKGEQPRLSMLREILEETGIDNPHLTFKGLSTWSTVEGEDFGGMYLYLAELTDEYRYETPTKTVEGILDWKEMNWILDSENMGVSTNLQSALKKIVEEESCYNYHGIFEGNTMIEQLVSPIDDSVEEDDQLRNDYLDQYLIKYIAEFHSLNMMAK